MFWLCVTNVDMSKHLPVKVEDFPEHVALMQSDDSIRFEREYDTIAVDGPFSQHAAKFYANATKNRYKNIIPRKFVILWHCHICNMLYAVIYRWSFSCGINSTKS